MAYIAYGYMTNPAAPLGQWVCTRSSTLGPYASSDRPPIATRSYPDFCGQCVSLATTLCPDLPVATDRWKQGAAVVDNAEIKPGTVIATFNDAGKYKGHTAIFHGTSKEGIIVYDQWITGNGKTIGLRTLHFKSEGLAVSNDPYRFSVVD